MNISFIRRFIRLAFYLWFVVQSSQIAAQNNPNCFQLFFPIVQAQAGDTVCLPLMVRDFEDIVSMQFVIFWNSNELEYVGNDLSDSALPGLDPNWFGPAAQNRIPIAWSSSTGFSISRPDSSILFRLCFRVKSGLSGFSPLHVGGYWPTVYEVVQSPDLQTNTLMPLSYLVGGISTDTAPISDLTLTSTCVSNALCDLLLGGASVVVSGGQMPYQYAWSGPLGFSDSTASVTNLLAGLYNVTVTDQAGSTVVVQLEIKTGFSNTIITPEITPAYCGQTTGCASLHLNGTNGPYTYQWSAGNSQTPYNCSLPPGQHTVTVTDENGCASIIPIEIENNTEILIPTMWVPIEVCNGTASLDATPTNNPGPFNYLWSTGETTATLEALAEAIYTVTVTQSAGACTGVGEFLVYDASTLTWGLNLQANCEDPGNTNLGSLVLEMSPLSNMAFPVMVSWSDGTTRLLESPAESGILDSLIGVSTGHYAVTVTDNNGCHSSLEVTLNCFNPPPTPGDYPWFYVQANPSNPDSCAGVYANNFEGISALKFSLTCQDFSADFKEIRNIQMPGLSLNSFELDPEGKWITLDWQSASPLSLPTESLLFEVCFTPLYEHVTESVSFTNQVGEPYLLNQNGPQAFIGKMGLAYYQTQTPVPAQVCNIAAIAPNCAADGNAQILMEACSPNTLVNGSYAYEPEFGDADYFNDLSGLLFADAGAYNIYIPQENVDPEAFFVFIPAIPAQAECVWPGDADNNNAVNHHDLLYIGLAYHVQGPSRFNASLDWTGQEALEWSESTILRHVNYKNIDSNGDGIINAADTLAIIQNWGRVINPAKDNPFDAPLDSFGNSLFPELTIDTDTLMPGESVNFPLLLGTQNSQLDSLYGLAFSISYDPSVVKDNIQFRPSDSWFGQPDRFLCIQKNFPRQGRLDVAITRTDGLPVSGWGAIGNVFIIIEDNIFGIEPLQADTTSISHLFFSEISSTSPGETPQIIDAPPVELVIRQQTVATKTPVLAEKAFILSPNPAAEKLWIESFSSLIHRIEISSADGSFHKTTNFGNPALQAQIELSNLPDGTYFARIFCMDGVVVKKFVVAR